MTPRYGKIYCHEFAHINTDECAAPELFTGGAKLAALSGDDGKLNSSQLADAIDGSGNVHQAQPAVVSITQACETGTVYELDEIAAIAEVTHSHDMRLHMDGARFANALVALDASPAEMTWKSGIDVLSFGGTKNGCLAAEAILFFNPESARSMPYLHKRSGQLLSKMRFVTAQLSAYLENGLWLNNARNANAMALRLSEGLAALPSLELAYPTRSNEVFVRLPNGLVEQLRQDGMSINDGELDGSAVRFVAAWNTSTEEVDSIVAQIAKRCG
jgi:threonine aldolase